MKLHLSHLLALGLAFLFRFSLCAELSPGVVDAIVFGDAASEQAHQFIGEKTKVVSGGLAEPARVSLPAAPADYYGGDLTFELKIDPLAQNYFTVKFWGSDVNGGQKALLYIDGEQLGYRHLGDYEALNHGSGEASFRDRFFYYTAVLPLALTHGREHLTLTIRTIGPIAGYQLGGGYDGYQKKMEAASRGYYRAYTHTTPALAGLEAEKQGRAPVPPVRPPLPDPSSRSHNDRNDRPPRGQLDERLQSQGSMAPPEIARFARLAQECWPQLDEATRRKTIAQLVAKIDGQSANAYDPTFFAKGVYQGDWGGSFSTVAAAIFQMNQFITPAQWKTLLEEKITVKNEPQTRRAAWTRMIQGNFDYARTHLARITNQAMFCLHGAYRSNRALQIINPAVAEPETTARRFLFQAAGLEPFRGNDLLDASGKLIGHEDPFGEHYLQITEKGLTREFTYVAIYGEVANDLIEYWELYGHDEILKKALLSANARAQMKYPDADDDGFRAMRMEGVIESRGPAYPDDVGYVQRKRGLSLLRLARKMAEQPEKFAGAEWAPYRQIATNLVGYGQQLLADNQKPEFGGAEGLADYLWLKKQPPAGVLLPHTNLKWYGAEELSKLRVTGAAAAAALEPHAWADEDNGTVALHDGELDLFVGLVMKANWGINGIARVHCRTPEIDRLATVVPDVQFAWGGEYSERPDWTNVQFMNANNPPEGPLQALQGEVLPFATQPAVRPTAAPDNPYCGYANFYSLRYGKYLIGMNTTRPAYGNARSYALQLPANFAAASAFDFITKTALPIKEGALEVGPQSTVVIKLNDEADLTPLPMAPRLLAPAGDETGLDLRWAHAASASSYLVKQKIPGGEWTELARTQGENRLTMRSAPVAGTLYTVTGINENGSGLESPAVALRGSDHPWPAPLLAWLAQTPPDPTSPPLAPRDLRGENVKKRVNLTWKVAKRGVTYDVLRASREAGPFTPVATGLQRTEWSDENLQFGQTYFYTVAAVDRRGQRGAQAPVIRFSPVDDTVPAPWQGVQIGPVDAENSEGLRDGVFSIRGSGGDIWGGEDECRFLQQKLTGNAEIVARMVGQQSKSAKSGLMFRASLEPNAKNVFLFRAADGSIVLQFRTGGGTDQQVNHQGFSDQPWLKLARQKDLITAFASRDGQAWTEIGQVTVKLPQAIHAGLAVTAHARGTINLSQFDHVQLKNR